MKSIDEFLLKLIEIKSETGQEKQLSDYLFECCKRLGFDEVFQDGFGNVVAVINAGKGKVLNFNAHMDTVNGFVAPEIVNGNVFGRGSADMKGAIAAMLFSARELLKEKTKLKGKVVYSFVVCEESGNPEIRRKGTKSVIEFLKQKDLVPSAVVIGESSQTDFGKAFGVVCRQRGRCTVDVDFFGSSAHGSFGVKKGANSYILANKFCHKLYKHAEQFNVLDLSINIAGGKTIELSYNKVPKRTRVQLEVRFSSNKLLEETIEKIKQCAFEAVKELVEEIESMEKSFVSRKDLSSIGYKFVGKDLYNGVGKLVYGPFDSSQSNFLEFVLKEARKMFKGKRVKLNSSVFGTDASFYIEAGVFKETPNIVVLGPGNQLQAHTSNEFVKIKHLKEYTKLYSQLAFNYLNKEMC